jgi:hypothetical protein
VIVRKLRSGETIVAGQTDHSKLVGQLAAHWGNAEFDAPRPYESVVRAATFHDYGWLRYETSPLINPESGEPYQFIKLPLAPEQMSSYQWSLDWMAEIDRYAGLIVNMHRTGLWKVRYDTIKHPIAYNLTNMPPEIARFIEKNEAWQERTRAAYDRDELWQNYRLMQIWDLLGLYFCCQDPYEDHIEPVPVRYGAGKNAGTKMTMKPLGEGRVAFDPYPFDVRPCRIQLGFKRLPAASFPSVEAFRRAYFQADIELMAFELS